MLGNVAVLISAMVKYIHIKFITLVICVNNLD